jgi:hypothetical protein
MKDLFDMNQKNFRKLTAGIRLSHTLIYSKKIDDGKKMKKSKVMASV